MPTLTVGINASIAAGATVNVALGTPLEFQGAPAVLTLLSTSDAVAATPQTQQVLVNVGANQMVPVAAGTPVQIASGAGQGPKQDEDLLAAGIALPAGSRVQWNVTNPASGAVLFRGKAFLQS